MCTWEIHSTVVSCRTQGILPETGIEKKYRTAEKDRFGGNPLACFQQEFRKNDECRVHNCFGFFFLFEIEFLLPSHPVTCDTISAAVCYQNFDAFI
jgi:hypothetical protein